MKKFKENLPLVTFGFLVLTLVILTAMPLKVEALNKCSSPPCNCICDDSCSCGAWNGSCWCTCMDPAMDYQCPSGGEPGDPNDPPWY